MSDTFHFSIIVGIVMAGVIAYALIHPSPDSQKMLGELAMALIVGKAAVSYPGGQPPVKPT